MNRRLAVQLEGPNLDMVLETAKREERSLDAQLRKIVAEWCELQRKKAQAATEAQGQAAP